MIMEIQKTICLYLYAVILTLRNVSPSHTRPEEATFQDKETF